MRLGKFHVVQLNRKTKTDTERKQNYWITSSTVMSSLNAIHSLQIYQLTHSSAQISNWANCAEVSIWLHQECHFVHSMEQCVRRGLSFSVAVILRCSARWWCHPDWNARALCNPVRDPDRETTTWSCSPDNRDQLYCGHQHFATGERKRDCASCFVPTIFLPSLFIMQF